MSENSTQEKTEQATQKRIDDARKKGQVVRSKDLSTAAVVLAGTSFIYAGNEYYMVRATEIFSSSFEFLLKVNTAPIDLVSFCLNLILDGMMLFFPFALVIFMTALIANSILDGLNFSTQNIQPQLSRINPQKGVKKIFSVNAIMEVAKSILKFFLVLLFVGTILYNMYPEIGKLDTQNIRSYIFASVDFLFYFVLLTSLSLLVIVLIDIPLQFWNYQKELKMTKQEVKDEHKEVEGNPEVKGRIKRQQREISNQRMLQDVPSANAIITNPTHYSVAIKYDDKKYNAPILIAKGTDEMAMQIRKIGRHHRVPIVSSPKLARSIFYSTRLKKEIPTGLYIAVAQVLAYVYQLRKYHRGEIDKPVLNSNLPIPDEYDKSSRR